MFCGKSYPKELNPPNSYLPGRGIRDQGDSEWGSSELPYSELGVHLRLDNPANAVI